jgi:hypothetical protein
MLASLGCRTPQRNGERGCGRVATTLAQGVSAVELCRTRGDRPVTLEQDRVRMRCPARQGRGDPRRQLCAAHLLVRYDRHVRQEERRLRQDGRVRRLPGECQRHRHRQVRVNDGRDVGADGHDRPVDRHVGARPEAAHGRRVAVRRLLERHDDQVVRRQLVLPQPGRRHEQAVARQPDREVALGTGDQAAGAEAASGRDERLAERRVVHPAIVRAGRERRQAASATSRTTSGASSTSTAQPSQRRTSACSSATGPSHQGQSTVIISFA